MVTVSRLVLAGVVVWGAAGVFLVVFAHAYMRECGERSVFDLINVAVVLWVAAVLIRRARSGGGVWSLIVPMIFGGSWLVVSWLVCMMVSVVFGFLE